MRKKKLLIESVIYYYIYKQQNYSTCNQNSLRKHKPVSINKKLHNINTSR